MRNGRVKKNIKEKKRAEKRKKNSVEGNERKMVNTRREGR